MYSVPVDEQETVISFTRNETGAEVWTNDTTVMTKLDKLIGEGWTLKDVGRTEDGDLIDKTYYAESKNLLSFRRLVKLTPAAMEARRRNIAKTVKKRAETRKESE